MSAFVERLAAAYWDQRIHEFSPGVLSRRPFAEVMPSEQDRCRNRIRAVLTEMRGAVTPEMTAAMWKVACPLKAGMTEVFQAAIDTALKEGQ